MSLPVVAALNLAPVKGLRLGTRRELVLGRSGARGDRVMYLVDERSRMVNAKRLGSLQGVVGELDERGSHLTLSFPDGRVLTGALEPAQEIDTSFYSRPRRARVIAGPFASALSEHAGERLRLVIGADGSSAVDRGREGAVSIVSRASLCALGELAGEGALDGRRFRMTIELEGVLAFAEDSWIGRRLRIGQALITPRGHVGRCAVTTRDPDTGEVDLATLEHLRELRRGASTSEPLALGVYAEVQEAGVVRVGDPVGVPATAPARPR